ncbi:mannose-1-phosphate guanylyltransferase [Fulvivirga sedimenti]|uniref:mannose-1-phosphate guanylyltransferase n=1 Tax=Fulvivirga sedimenti TaxID=2879465 RepID=A0A9X1L1D7_9BACT|nr:mannose-1-phosphate guanylyltransferase [Fulvivirga sedimenti]MCA6078122.1 mannose-1-phosphate guanylyltransferase [Fulvivirga sedimenti]
MNKNNYLVIMAGGIGSRFWPFSRNDKPKQFLDILGIGKSLIQLTFERFTSLCPPENVLVVTNAEYADLVAEQLPALSSEQILLEPFRRNTAPCIAYAAYKIQEQNPDAVMIVAPSDHVILNTDLFIKTVSTAVEQAADQEKLITIGINPNRPETGFGYIQYLENTGNDLKKVKTFTEKPEKSLAEKFIESGDFVWNSGIFVWGVRAIITGFHQHLPEVAATFDEIRADLGTSHENDSIYNAYSHTANISIDYGIMEKSSDVYVVLGDFDWSDLGSWDALYDMSEKNEDGNVVKANALLYDTTGSLITGPKDQLILVQGLDDYLVTVCDNVFLVCKRGDEKRFRDYVADVKEKKGKEFL